MNNKSALNIIINLLYILTMIIPLITIFNNNISSLTKSHLMFLDLALITIILILRFIKKRNK